MQSNRKTLYILSGVGVAMLGLGFASDPLYDTFCKVTGYGGTPKIAEDNLSEIIDRTVTVEFDSNVAQDLPWKFRADQRRMDVKLGQSGLAYYTVENTSDEPVIGVANFNVMPIKAAPFFVKTDCFCFEEQVIPQEFSHGRTRRRTRLSPYSALSMAVSFGDSMPRLGHGHGRILCWAHAADRRIAYDGMVLFKRVRQLTGCLSPCGR